MTPGPGWSAAGKARGYGSGRAAGDKLGRRGRKWADRPSGPLRCGAPAMPGYGPSGDRRLSSGLGRKWPRGKTMGRGSSMNAHSLL